MPELSLFMALSPDGGARIRSLYVWVGACALAGLGLVLGNTPSSPTLSAATASPTPRQTLVISAPIPATGLPAGTVVMASFPELHRTLKGKLIEGSGQAIQVEFEVPCEGTPGQVEMWADYPDGGRARWKPAVVQGPQARFGEAEVESGGQPRDSQAYRYPAVQARAAAPPPRVPSGLPAGFAPLSQDQLKSMAERHGARAPK